MSFRKGAVLGEGSPVCILYSTHGNSQKDPPCGLRSRDFAQSPCMVETSGREILNVHHVLRPLGLEVRPSCSYRGIPSGLVLTPGEGASKQGRPGPLCGQGVPWMT